MEYEIAAKEIAPAGPHLPRPVTMETIGDRIGGAFGRSWSTPASGAQWAGPPFMLYPEDCEREFEIAVCMPVVPGAAGGERAARGGARRASRLTLHVGPTARSAILRGAAEVDDR